MLTSAVLLFLYSLVNKIQYLIIFVQCTVQIFAKISPKSVTSLADLEYYLLCIYFFVELFHFLCKLASLSNDLFVLCKLCGYFSTSLAHCFFIHFFYLLKFQAPFVCSPVRSLDGRETTGRRAQVEPPVSPFEQNILQP